MFGKGGLESCDGVGHLLTHRVRLALFGLERGGKVREHRLDLCGSGAALGLSVGNDLTRIKRLEKFFLLIGSTSGPSGNSSRISST